jgi:hypothetical protein
LLRRIGLLDFSRFLNTDYMKRCSEQQVPVPPDWSETSTQWQYQGALTYNMLAPGDYAGVWTWEDPSKRGACVALPRGSGGPGSFAGIICQSAATGAACFWDNLLRAPAPGDRIEWASRTLQINQLQDGSNLSAPCTDCHTGNNVFLLTPDDPSWQHLLRDLPHEPGSNFTTQVEHSSDWRDDHYRYVPITTATPRPGWNNWRRAPGCSGGCHEQPSVAPITGTMPPTCGLAGCYAPR